MIDLFVQLTTLSPFMAFYVGMSMIGFPVMAAGLFIADRDRKYLASLIGK